MKKKINHAKKSVASNKMTKIDPMMMQRMQQLQQMQNTPSEEQGETTADNESAEGGMPVPSGGVRKKNYKGKKF